MKLTENVLNIGAEREFSVLHVSDTHLTYADEREQDNGRKLEMAKNRSQYFADAEQNLEETCALAKRFGATIVHTGDLLDFVSQANLDAARKFAEENDVFMAAGNHEFSLYVGEAWEDAAYRNQSLAKVQASFKNDIRFSSRVMHGVNFVAIDNSYYLFEQWQLDALKGEVAKGLPIVLMMHTPLYTPELYDFILAAHGQLPVYLMNVPEEGMKGYTEHRYKQQKADAVTEAAYDYIVGEPLIQAVLAGHIHKDYEGLIDGRIPQIVTGLGSARHIVIR